MSSEAIFDHEYSRGFIKWFEENNCSVMFTSYKTNRTYIMNVFNNSLELRSALMARPTGITISEDTKTLAISNMGNIIRYTNSGAGTFDGNKYDAMFYPVCWHINGDTDVHDLRINKSGQLYYCSSEYNCIAKTSSESTFNIEYTPPWITKTYSEILKKEVPPAEDRCHLNGLVLDDATGLPRYVTAACNLNYEAAWRDHINKGVLYDIKENKFITSGLSFPHSPRFYLGKLWVLESGTGYFGYIIDGKFQPKKFIPGFLRGLDFINNYAVVCASSDRHDAAFEHIPLGRILKSQSRDARVGIFIIDLDTYTIKEHFEFKKKTNGTLPEMYDVIILPNICRPYINDLSAQSSKVIIS